MKINITVNNNTFKSFTGETILSVLNKNGIRIPTLCNIPSLTPTGACRLCVVEVEGENKLVTACSQPVKNNMIIYTHSPRVLKARKTNLELLLANHPDDCLYCDNNQNCELRELASELNIRERKLNGQKKEKHIDSSSQAILKDDSKCILCGRCIRICDEILNVNALDYSGRGHETKVDTCMSKGLNFSTCISCGQCIMACPTGALSEMSSLERVLTAIRNKNTNVIIQISKEVLDAAAISMGLKAGEKTRGIIINAMKKCGINKVFDSGFAGDIFIEESKKELNQYLDKDIPYILTHCPAIKSYIEQFFPLLIKNLNHIKSNWQIMAGIIKNVYTKENEINNENVFNVAVTTCTASKAEATRPDMMTNGVPDLDAVLSVDEIIKLIKLSGIELHKLKKEDYDAPYNMSSSAASFLNMPGGLTETVMRGNDNIKKQDFRGIKTQKQLSLKYEKRNLNILITNEIRKALPHLQAIQSKRSEFNIIEITSCPGSCHDSTSSVFLYNSKTSVCNKDIYKEDDRAALKNSGNNPLLRAFYEDNYETNKFYYNLD